MKTELTASLPNPVHPSPKGFSFAVAAGDGIGPEITKATLEVLRAAIPGIEPVEIVAGEQSYLRGEMTGLDAAAWEAIEATGYLLKGPVTTPQGAGYKSVNVTLRKTLGLFANVRPVKSYAPFVPTHFPKLDVVIVRENEEDLYAGIEHQQTADVVQCLKLITRPGCERIVRYAFEYARVNGRKEVCCMTKDNIMKQTDGLFHKVFDEIALEYPEIKTRHLIIDIGAALLAQRPEQFDVIVTPNLYGDIVSDIVAQVAGSVGLAGSANIGEKTAMFEAIHGSAPDIAGQDKANPSGMIHAAAMMLAHAGKTREASLILNALLKTLEDGIHTPDISQEGHTAQVVGTQAFAAAIIARLGQRPTHLAAIDMPEVEPIHIRPYERKTVSRTLVGADIFVHFADNNANLLAEKLRAATGPEMKLKMITNRGVKVWPDGNPATFCTDHWRCRFVSNISRVDGESKVFAYVPAQHVINLLQDLLHAGIEVIKTEHLYNIDGQRGFSLGQGE
jgi:isocitrate dehydrogenase